MHEFYNPSQNEKYIPIPTLPMAEARMLREIESQNRDKPYIINISGHSASGKSTLSNRIAELFPGTSVFSMDNYLTENLTRRRFNPISPNPERPYYAALDPEIYDIGVMLNDINSLRNNRVIQMPIFDELTKERVGHKSFNPTNIVIVEGIHSFQDQFLKTADFSIWINASLHDRLIRRLIRSNRDYKQEDVNSLIQRYLMKEEPTYRIYEPELKSKADLIFENPSNPEIDYKKYSGKKVETSVSEISLNPIDTVGSKHSGEKISIVTLPDSTRHIRYAVNGSILVDADISYDTIDALQEYYSVEN